jgi:hypothetical protein
MKTLAQQFLHRSRPGRRPRRRLKQLVLRDEPVARREDGEEKVVGIR